MKVGIAPFNQVFSGDFLARAGWTFTGVHGNLLRNDIGLRISNLPALVAPLNLVDAPDSVTFHGIELAITSQAGQRGSVRFDGFSLSLQAGTIAIGDWAGQIPEPGTVTLLGLGLAGLLRRRGRRH